MQIYHNNLIIKEQQRVNQNTSVNILKKTPENSFEAVFDEQLQFSKHANMRLNSREINLSTEQIKRVETGVNKAREKGITDSLVLVDNVALLVNIKKNIVITAMNQNNNDNVYTNIDGAVIV